VSQKNKQQTASKKYLPYLVAAVVVIFLGAILFNSISSKGTTGPLDLPAELGVVGTLAPDFELATAEGGKAKISDYRGKIVMLNFWATWCGPCQREIPDFIGFQQKYGPKGLTIIGVALDEAGKVTDFIKASRINYPVLIGNGEIAQAYGGVRSIPTTVLIDREGKIINSFTGLRPPEQWAQAIEKLL